MNLKGIGMDIGKGIHRSICIGIGNGICMGIGICKSICIGISTHVCKGISVWYYQYQYKHLC